MSEIGTRIKVVTYTPKEIPVPVRKVSVPEKTEPVREPAVVAGGR